MIKLFIDGVDIYNKYGVFVSDGGFSKLITLPAIETNAIQQNDWFEYSGVEIPENFTPALDVKQFQMPLISTNVSKINDFITFLISKTYHSFTSDIFINGFDKIRYVSCTSISYIDTLAKFTITFSDDSKQFLINSTTYNNLYSPKTNYLFDNLDFGDIGVCVLAGTNSEILKSANAKENYIDGVTGNYNSGAMKFKTKDVNLKLNIYSGRANATTKEAKIKSFWQNYYFFAWKMIYDKNVINITINGEPYQLKYYYNTCSVSKFYVLQNWAFWLDFNINIKVINPN